MNFFVTGASGLIGKRLIPVLTARGDTVVALSRKPGEAKPGVEWIVGDPTQAGPWLETLANCDAVVHLAGEPILGQRWSDVFLKRVRDSRVDSTRLIAERLAKGSKVTVFVSGSAVGYYGMDAGDATIAEDSPAGTDVLGTMTKDWEAAAEPAKAAGVRVAHPRTGLVLDPAGGALPSLAMPFKLFAGGRMGSGKQYLPWIHYADMIGLLLFALDQASMTGGFNCTAPAPVRNAEFARELGIALRRPCWLPVPKFAVKTMLGRASAMVLGSMNAVPKKALDAGYVFKFGTIREALAEMYGR